MKKYTYPLRKLNALLKKPIGWWELLGFLLKARTRLRYLKEQAGPKIVITGELRHINKVSDRIEKIIDLFAQYQYERDKASTIKDGFLAPLKYYREAGRKLSQNIRNSIKDV